MNLNTLPTKGNLIAVKNSLALARQGYSLMDKKRNILLRELLQLIDEARGIQTEIDSTYCLAYAALQDANISLGVDYVKELASTVPIDEGISIKTRSVMGTEIPLVQHKAESFDLSYSFYNTRECLDIARVAFTKVKELTIRLSMIENAAYRLAANISKTQKRANALKNITIPRYEHIVKNISNALEEKEREEFTRLKVIKRMQR